MLLPYSSRQVYSVKLQEGKHERYECFTSNKQAAKVFDSWCLLYPIANVWLHKGHELLDCRRIL